MAGDKAAALQALEDLIARCALGDQAAFTALYDATAAKLFAVCVRVLGRTAAAEDAMQEALSLIHI